MGAVAKMPIIGSIAATGGLLAVLQSSATARNYVSRTLGISAPGGLWRLIAILLALINFKVLPFVWHIRLLGALVGHFYVRKRDVTPADLFKPVVTCSHTPVLEGDYNLHKSNSTYFADLDIARMNIVSRLLRKGIQHLSKHGAKLEGEDSKPKGRFIMALGAVSCQFKRELGIYESFEIWSRVLCWDRKWIYLVSHLVKPGAVKGREGKDNEALGDLTPAENERRSKAVFATSIAKYVIKEGRITVPPERVLQLSGLLPEKPAGVEFESTSQTEASTPRGTHIEGDTAGALLSPAVEQAQTQAKTSRDQDASVGRGDVSWESIEEKRLEGLRFANMFAGLDGLHDIFPEVAAQGDVLGRYSDFGF